MHFPVYVQLQTGSADSVFAFVTVNLWFKYAWLNYHMQYKLCKRGLMLNNAVGWLQNKKLTQTLAAEGSDKTLPRQYKFVM